MTVRSDILSGQSVLDYSLKIYKQRLDFVSVRNYSTLSNGTVVGERAFDVGGSPVIWGDVAVNSGGLILRLGSAGGWLYAFGTDNLALVTDPLGVSPPTPTGHQRVGLIADGGDWRVFYVGTDGYLHILKVRRNGDGTLSWLGNISSTHFVDVPFLSGMALACHPTTTTRVALVVYSSPLVWVDHYSLSGSTLSWDNHSQNLVHRADYVWSDVLCSDVVVLPDGTEVLTVPVAPNGASMAFVWQATQSQWGHPHFILASPGADMSRRVWVYSLSIINGRIWAVCYNDLQGDIGFYYAGYTGLLSSADGISWRDEGFVTAQDLRGTLCVSGDYMYVVSMATVFKDAVNYRLGRDTSRSIRNVSGLEFKLDGDSSTAELSVGTTGGDVEVGDRLVLELGATGDMTPAFTGYLDQPEIQYSPGAEERQWIARGVLGRMIGETAYAPPTSLWWPGRRIFYTNFVVDKIAVDGVAPLSGYWLPEITLDDLGNVLTSHNTCSQTGNALVPQPWEFPDLFYRVKYRAAKDFMLSFWGEDDTTFEKTHWRVGTRLDGDSWYLTVEQVTNEVVTTWYRSISPLSNFGKNTPTSLTLHLGPGTMLLDLYWWSGVANETRADLSPLLWPRPGISPYAPPPSYQVGLWCDVSCVNMIAGSGLNDIVLVLPKAKNQTDIPSTYEVAIAATGAPDSFQWRKDGGAWSVVTECTTYGTSIDGEEIQVSWTADTGHVAGTTWRFPGEQPITYVDDVLVCGGHTPVTVRDVLATASEIASTPVVFDDTVLYTAATAEEDLPLLFDVDVDVTLNIGDQIQVFNENYVLSALSGTDGNIMLHLTGEDNALSGGEYIRLGYNGDGHYQWPLHLRLVVREKILSLHNNERVVAAWHRDFSYSGGKLICSGAATVAVRPLSWSVDELYWDYNQPASSVLSLLLDRRRVYLYEQPNGTVLATVHREQKRLIGADTPVNGMTYYRRAVMSQTKRRDARGLVAIAGVIGAGTPGSRVYMLDEEAAHVSVRSSTIDNPWVWSELDALLEAQRIIEDFRRAMTTHEVVGALDLQMRLGDTFDCLGMDGQVWSGLVQGYQFSLVMADRLQHQATWTASQRSVSLPIGYFEAGSVGGIPEAGISNFDECGWG